MIIANHDEWIDNRPIGKWLSSSADSRKWREGGAYAVVGDWIAPEPGVPLDNWSSEIACMWHFTKNNGITEGFHTKMEVIQRRAFGFFFPSPPYLVETHFLQLRNYFATTSQLLRNVTTPKTSFYGLFWEFLVAVVLLVQMKKNLATCWL